MTIGPYQIDIRLLFVACIVCGEERRLLDMYTCAQCDEPLCQLCFQDGFCSDECRDVYADNVNAGEDWGDEEVL